MAVNQAIVERALAAVREVLETERRPMENRQAETPNQTPAESAECGSPGCAGCYEVIRPQTGEVVHIHPPKVGAEWEPKGRVQ